MCFLYLFLFLFRQNVPFEGCRLKRRPKRDYVFRRCNPGKVPPQALGLDRQPVSQTHTLTPNPNPNLNLNSNPNAMREMRLTNVSLTDIIIEVTFPAVM